MTTSAQRSYNMSRIRSGNTTPERTVRRELWSRGYRYRLNDRRLPGTPDLVLPKYRAVIFINGCFWHGHRGCTKYVEPKTNAGFWKDKIARNIARDELNAQRLDTLAWTVITVWECELSKKNLDANHRAHRGRSAGRQDQIRALPLHPPREPRIRSQTSPKAPRNPRPGRSRTPPTKKPPPLRDEGYG